MTYTTMTEIMSRQDTTRTIKERIEEEVQREKRDLEWKLKRTLGVSVPFDRMHIIDQSYLPKEDSDRAKRITQYEQECMSALASPIFDPKDRKVTIYMTYKENPISGKELHSGIYADGTIAIIGYKSSSVKDNPRELLKYWSPQWIERRSEVKNVFIYIGTNVGGHEYDQKWHGDIISSIASTLELPITVMPCRGCIGDNLKDFHQSLEKNEYIRIIPTACADKEARFVVGTVLAGKTVYTKNLSGNDPSIPAELILNPAQRYGSNNHQV